MPKPRERDYEVHFVATANMSGSVRVRATSQADAERKAAENIGDIEWKYEGLAGDPKVTEVAEA